jgi:hypothetical protein
MEARASGLARHEIDALFQVNPHHDFDMLGSRIGPSSQARNVHPRLTRLKWAEEIWFIRLAKRGSSAIEHLGGQHSSLRE